jgi:hypothetical protein
MARQPADPSARLAVLRAVRKAVGPGEEFIGEEMAKVLRVSWRSLSDLIDDHPEWPVLQRGSEGIPWRFNGRALIDAMIASYQAVQKERAARSARIQALSGVAIPKEAAERFSLVELKQIDGLQREIQRRKVEQRGYVPIDEHRRIVTSIFTTVQTEILSAAPELDPAGKWPAEVRAAVIDHNRTLLVRLHDQVRDRLTDDVRPARRARRRAGGAGKR